MARCLDNVTTPMRNNAVKIGCNALRATTFMHVNSCCYKQSLNKMATSDYLIAATE